MLILVDGAAESVVSAYVQVGDAVRVGDRSGYRTQRSGLIQCLVGPVPIVVGFELAQGVPEVVLVPDQDAVRSSWRQVCAHRSMSEFIRGIRTPDGLVPCACRNLVRADRAAYNGSAGQSDLAPSAAPGMARA